MDCCASHCEERSNLPNLSASDDLAKQLAAMVQQVWHDKGLPQGLINKEVTSEFAKRLWAGVGEGYGNPAKEFNAGKIDWETPDFKMLAALQKNVWQFSAAKNYTQLRELSNALIGDDGKLRTFNQFKEAAFKINDTHINQHLKAEYNLAVAGGQMAGKWIDIENNQDTLPMLEFDAVLDGRTTEICKPLNGVLLPINHPFWNTHYPPNHWGCRSTVRQRANGKITDDSKIPTIEISPLFQTNLGKQGLVFPKGHAYFIDLPNQVLKQVEAMRIDPNFETRIQGKKGGYVDIHALTDQNKKEQHIRVSKILADKGHQVKLMPEINRNETEQRSLFFPELRINNYSNPDTRINGLLGDFKIPDSNPISERAIANALKATNKKEIELCVFSMLDNEYSMQKILSSIKGSFGNNNYPFVKEIWLVLKDETVLKIPSGITQKRNFYKIVNAF